MKTVLVVAPHPDDETLGCGMTILRLVNEGASVHWLTMTTMSGMHGFYDERIEQREEEIRRVAALYNFRKFIDLDLQQQRWIKFL
ncbi:PIG-L deacetylase family protein [Sedimenticola sp.]|uniref:PIG-L deacetylase family protein n=1 Tax=Sedimenticola sp. TaxID=1940285 RepID=UPI003D09A73E